METKIVNVKYVNQPKPGKKEGSIKDDTDEFYGASPAILGMMEPDNRYKIQFDSRVYQGKTFKSIRAVEKVEESSANGAAGQPHSRVATNPTDAERMWTCALVGHFIACGRVTLDLESISEATTLARKVWAMNWGDTLSNEMNDDIPF